MFIKIEPPTYKLSNIDTTRNIKRKGWADSISHTMDSALSSMMQMVLSCHTHSQTAISQQLTGWQLRNKPSSLCSRKADLLLICFQTHKRIHRPGYILFSRRTSPTPSIPLNTVGTIPASLYPSFEYIALARLLRSLVSIRR